MKVAAEDEEALSSFGFLSRKPMLVVLNLSEGQSAPEMDYPHQHSQVVALQGKLEMDIAQLPPDEAEMFLAEYGIEEPSLNRMIRLSYDLLGLQSFFTVGADEVPRLDRAARGHRARGGRRNPYRPAEGLYPRRGGGL